MFFFLRKWPHKEKIESKLYQKVVSLSFLFIYFVFGYLRVVRAWEFGNEGSLGHLWKSNNINNRIQSMEGRRRERIVSALGCSNLMASSFSALITVKAAMPAPPSPFLYLYIYPLSINHSLHLNRFHSLNYLSKYWVHVICF